MKTRPATTQELLEKLRCRNRTSFRHFVHEISNPRAEYGISHRQHTTAKVQIVCGKPMVKYSGDLTELTGTHYTLPSGTTFITDIRVKSKYLP